MARALLAGLLLSFWVAAGCAPRRVYTPSPVPGWELVSEVLPEAPEELSSRDRESFERAERALVMGDLQSAAREIERLARRYDRAPAVAAAEGYLELRLGNRREAEQRFSAALAREPRLAAAQAGMFLSAYARGEEELAFERLRDLSHDHPTHPFVERYLPKLQLELAETKLQVARSLREQGQNREAAEQYRQALRIAPAAGLYVEAAQAELASGDPESAARSLGEGIERYPDDAELYRLRGEAYSMLGELERALADYRRAHALRPNDEDLRARYEEVRRDYEREHLPPQFLEIGETERITRAELAALLYLKLRPLYHESLPRRAVIATDLAGSWAGDYVREVVGAGIMNVYPNYTFQPDAYVNRNDLAGALAAAIDVLAPDRVHVPMSVPAIADVSEQHLNYRSIAQAVALGLMPLDPAGRFEPRAFVSGREAIEAVDALSRRIVAQ